MDLTKLYDLLPNIIQYIEGAEVMKDGEWGLCRDLEELIADKKMPDLYYKLIALRNGDEFNPNK